MKRPTFLLTPLLLLAASCGTRDARPADSATPMDADFEPSEPHPWTSRTEQRTGQRLTAESYTAHGDTLGALVITPAESDGQQNPQLRHFAFSSATDGAGSATCAYNDFAELTDLWVETEARRTHSMLLWDDDGNLVSINQETWTHEGDSSRHELQVIEYRYTDHTAYGNWHASQAETIGGPVALALHAGRMGRAPWTLPEAYTCVTSVLSQDMVESQETERGSFSYTFDHNGRVVTERQQLHDQQHTYEYTYH